MAASKSSRMSWSAGSIRASTRWRAKLDSTLLEMKYAITAATPAAARIIARYLR